jgi:hypothetical protein
MLDFPEIMELSADVARVVFPGRRVKRISVEPRIGAFGNDVLWITAVMQSDDPAWPDGEAISTYSLALHDQMEKLGDERLAVVDLMRPEEAAGDVEPES